MNQTMREVMATVAMAAVLGVGMTGFAGCAGCNKSVINDTPVSTPTTAITATVAPTPTEEAEPTLVPTEEPVPSPIPTPSPTATPIPTPTPVITVDENATLIGSAKMGDNVWYDFYDDGTLVVRGTGATYDFKDYNDMQLTIRKQTDFLKDESLYNVIKAIIIKEGITEIGTSALDSLGIVEKVVFPTSLKKIGDMAFASVGCFANIEWIGLDINKVEISNTAFWLCGNEHKVMGLNKYTAEPTPTPVPQTPTATPLPNPDKPRKVATLAITDTITYEFWDNDIMYVKGSGAIPNQSELFALDSAIYNPTGYTFAEKVKTVIVDEGITSFGKYSFRGLRSANEWYLPTTLTYSEKVNSGGKIFHGYFNGRAVTVKESPNADWTKTISVFDFYKVLEDEAYALEKEVTIIWE